MLSKAGDVAYKDDTCPTLVKDLDKIQLAKIQATALKTSPASLPVANLEDVSNYRKIDRIDSLVNVSFNKLGFNGNVLVAENGKVLYEKSIGYADFNTGEPLKINSIFQLASVSKQFTAMCIMILKQQGKLDYDDELTKYIPELPYHVTLRQMLNHTSGLPIVAGRR